MSKRIREQLENRYNAYLKETVTQYKQELIDNKKQLIDLAEMVYDDKYRSLAPNLLFEFILTAMEKSK